MGTGAALSVPMVIPQLFRTLRNPRGRGLGDVLGGHLAHRTFAGFLRDPRAFWSPSG